MNRSFMAVLLPVVVAGAGCFEESRTRLIQPGPMSSSMRPIQPERHVSKAPATEETGRRVITLGQKILMANPKLGLRPTFLTIGAPHPELFHRGGTIEAYQIYISEGMVNACKDDGELAALLCLELGKIVSEREAMARPEDRNRSKQPSIRESIGSDSGGTFGPPDGTRVMEQAKYDQQRKAAETGPRRILQPTVLARQYLTQSGFEAQSLDRVAPLLRQAEDHDTIERQLNRKTVR